MIAAADNTDRESAKARWRIRDIIDLEYFLYTSTHPEENNNSASHTSKDRDIFLSRLRNLRNDGFTAARRLLIRRWLDIRRESEAVTLPGSVYSEVNRICQVAAAVLGLFAGISLAMSLLNYSGIRPLNVSVYMGVAVFSQILILLLLVVVLLFRAASRSLARSSILVRLLGRMLSTVLLKVQKGAAEHIGGRNREALAAASSLLRGRRQVYGSLFFWPVFILTQVFAICFNIGLLGATLAKLSGSDVAFGWQSTFQVSDPAVYRLVEALALPWRWMVPSSLAHPSLDAIMGSHIILIEGIASLETPDLVAWWPFLCLSVLFYGLLPRLVLLISGLFVQRHLLARLRFDHSACNRLVRSMTRPTFSTAGVPATAPGQDTGAPLPSTAGKAPHVEGGYVALVPEDLSGNCDGLEDVAVQGLSIKVTDRKTFATGDADESAVLDLIEDIRKAPGFAGVLLLQEAWQPPILENLNFLKQLRRGLGETAGIVVGLIGKPRTDTLFTAPREENVRIWKNRVDALGDPYLEVERLVSHD